MLKNLVLGGMITATGMTLLACQPTEVDTEVLVDVTDEDPGENCANGGTQVDYGIDVNQDGTVDSDEVDGTYYVCNGTDGTSGTSGSDGLNTLVTVTPEPSGANCIAGGQRIDHGVDVDGSMILEMDEIEGTSYVCDAFMPASPGTILLYNDAGFFGAGENPVTAAAALLGATVTTTTDETMFDTAFDGGTFDLVVILDANFALPAGVRSRVVTRIADKEALIFSYYNLDADVPLATLLGVTLGADLVSPPTLYPAGAQTYDFFGAPFPEFVKPGLGTPDLAADNGDQLSLAATGWIAARSGSPTGPGSIAVTNDAATIVLGFLPYEYTNAATLDRDADGLQDLTQLFVNLFSL